MPFCRLKYPAYNVIYHPPPPIRRGGDRQGSEYRWGQGQCFSLTNGLAWEETWDPCSGRPTARAHEEWGYCQVLSTPPPPSPPSPPPPSAPSPAHLQAGTSAALLPDRTALIGTPGPHTWRGTVFAVSTSDVSIPNLTPPASNFLPQIQLTLPFPTSLLSPPSVSRCIKAGSYS